MAPDLKKEQNKSGWWTEKKSKETNIGIDERQRGSLELNSLFCPMALLTGVRESIERLASTAAESP